MIESKKRLFDLNAGNNTVLSLVKSNKDLNLAYI